ncbi:MAG: winged helix-turn-helix transcriptional regulator, partial [Chloroflexi bacterium]|nr:winged helix-turn-helix transcriptional regulator [Chloroflexota bacterium]
MEESPRMTGSRRLPDLLRSICRLEKQAAEVLLSALAGRDDQDGSFQLAHHGHIALRFGAAECIGKFIGQPVGRIIDPPPQSCGLAAVVLETVWPYPLQRQGLDFPALNGCMEGGMGAKRDARHANPVCVNSLALLQVIRRSQDIVDLLHAINGVPLAAAMGAQIHHQHVIPSLHQWMGVEHHRHTRPAQPMRQDDSPAFITGQEPAGNRQTIARLKFHFLILQLRIQRRHHAVEVCAARRMGGQVSCPYQPGEQEQGNEPEQGLPFPRGSQDAYTEDGYYKHGDGGIPVIEPAVMGFSGSGHGVTSGSIVPPSRHLTECRKMDKLSIKIFLNRRPYMNHTHRLETFAQLKTLSDARRMQVLRLLMAAPSTLTQLAGTLGQSPAWVRHHLLALESAGLVELAEVRTTGTVTEKFYRSKA